MVDVEFGLLGGPWSRAAWSMRSALSTHCAIVFNGYGF